MFNLTGQQQKFLCVVLLLLLTGWTVKAWRTAHPGPPVPIPAERCRFQALNTATNCDEALDQIVLRDPRYHRDAYLFVREALDHTQKMLKTGKSQIRPDAPEETVEVKIRHVSGQELLAGIRDYAL